MKKLFVFVSMVLCAALVAAQVKVAAGDVNADAKAQKKGAPVQAKAQKKDAKAEKEKKEAMLLDLNSASRDDLIRLKGVGEAYADKIIKHRPYTNKTQVISQAGVPESAYRKFAGKVIARQK